MKINCCQSASSECTVEHGVIKSKQSSEKTAAMIILKYKQLKVGFSP